MVTILNLKRGEGKTMTFTITDSDGTATDVSLATLTFTVKKRKTDEDVNIIFQKDDVDFNKTQAAVGIVTVPISETDTEVDAGKYYGELKTFFSSDAVDKSQDIVLNIAQDVF